MSALPDLPPPAASASTGYVAITGTVPTGPSIAISTRVVAGIALLLQVLSDGDSQSRVALIVCSLVWFIASVRPVRGLELGSLVVEASALAVTPRSASG